VVSGALGLAAASLLTNFLRGMPAPMGFDPLRIVPASPAVAMINSSAAGIRQTLANEYKFRWDDMRAL